MQTITLKNGKEVTIIKIISKHVIKVLYGVNTKGIEITGLVFIP